MAKDCPDKPPMVCKNCQEEGKAYFVDEFGPTGSEEC